MAAMGLDEPVPRDSGWSVIVPVKGLASAKSRLTTPDAPEFALAFLVDALSAVNATPGVREVLVATSDPTVADAATRAGADVVDDRDCPGINAAAAHAAGLRRTSGGVVVMVADLPCLTPVSLGCALALAEPHPSAVLADHDGTGTTLWLGTPGTAVATAFGAQSRHAHRARGAVDLVEAHPDAAAVLMPARCDVDTVDDLRRAVELGVGPATAAVLLSIA